MYEYEGHEGFEGEGWYEDYQDLDDAEQFEQDCLSRDHEGDDPAWGELVEDGFLDAAMEDQISGLESFYTDVEF